MDNNELLDKASQHYEEQKELQREAVSEIGQAEGLGKTETVTLGQTEIKVKNWIPGGIEKELGRFVSAEEQGNHGYILENMDKLVDVLTNLCVEEPFNKEVFWAEYYDQWGMEGMVTSFHRIAEPGLEGMEERIEVDDMERKQNALGNSQRRNQGWQRR